MSDFPNECQQCGRPNGGKGVCWECAVPVEQWRVGDIVTRYGDDEHEIISITDDHYLLDVKCIVPPGSGWIAEGEVEGNLARRYSFVRRG